MCERGHTGYERQKHPIPALTTFFSSADIPHNDLKSQPRGKHHCAVDPPVSFETRNTEADSDVHYNLRKTKDIEKPDLFFEDIKAGDGDVALGETKQTGTSLSYK